MTEARPADYWFSTSALYIQLNAIGNRNYIHANCASGSVIMCYMKGISGLEYDNGHNYRRWTLQASPTVFHDSDVRYVYVAIPKSEAVNDAAQLVFPSEKIDIYGCNADGGQIGPTDYYYIFTQGVISASKVDGVDTDRGWTTHVDCGTLASDQAIASGGDGSWWQYDSITDKITFLKEILSATFEKLTAAWASITTLVLGGTTLTGVAEDPAADQNSKVKVATPDYGEKAWVSKRHNDEVNGTITFNNSAIVKNGLVVGVFQKDAQVGIGSASGVKIEDDGTIIAKDMELSGSLNVPTIKYNSIEVLAGTRWDSAGKGRIKEIVDTDDDTHKCRFILDLNDGEPGEFVEGDILRGFWHDLDGTKNATENIDDHKGNIQRAGFMSLYCRVTNVEDVVRRTVDDVDVYVIKDDSYVAEEGDVTLAGGLVTTVMRQYQNEEGETLSYSPYPEKNAVLSVSGSFRTDKPERQKFFVYTTSYIARFADVNTWEWEENTFKGGWGDLTGFTMLEERDGTIYRKEFEGEALATGNAYIYGVLDQFTRFSDKVEIVLSRADGTITAGTQIRADFLLKNVEGTIIEDGYTLSITRQSGDDDADAAWNAAMAAKYPTGIPSALYFSEADVPANGAVFVVASSRIVGGETYTTSSAFTLTRPEIADVLTLLLTLSPSINADGTLAEGETATLTAQVVNTYGTAVSGFSFAVTRSTDDSDSDTEWNNSHSMTDNAIQLTIDDLGTDNAVFKVVATKTESGILSRQITAQQVVTRITKQSLSIDLGRSSETAKAEAVNVALSPKLVSGSTDITDKTLYTDWLWLIETGDDAFDTEWDDNHKNQRELNLTTAQLPENWQQYSPILFTCVCNYRGTEVRSVAPSTRAYPRFRQGETFYLDLDVTFEGTGYEDSDFSIEVVDSQGLKYDWAFTRAISKFSLEFQGTVNQNMILGKYRITLWYHKGQTDQSVLDFDPAFELVSSTEEI